MPGKFVLLLSLSCGFSVILVSCSSLKQTDSSVVPAPTISPIKNASGDSEANTANNTNPAKNDSQSSEKQAPDATSSPSPTQKTAESKPPLTVEKLKNAEYFFLAKGPIKLTNGEYKDEVTQRTYTLSDVVAYGDINQDGIKDAVTALKVAIPSTGTFSYLVAVVNDAGLPRNVSTEFMGPEVKVKNLKINSDYSIGADLGQYQAGDPECCPSVEIQRNYKLRLDQNQSSPKKQSQN